MRKKRQSIPPTWLHPELRGGDTARFQSEVIPMPIEMVVSTHSSESNPRDIENEVMGMILGAIKDIVGIDDKKVVLTMVNKKDSLGVEAIEEDPENEFLRLLEVMLSFSKSHPTSDADVIKLSYAEWSRANACVRELLTWITKVNEVLAVAESYNMNAYAEELLKRAGIEMTGSASDQNN